MCKKILAPFDISIYSTTMVGFIPYRNITGMGKRPAFALLIAGPKRSPYWKHHQHQKNGGILQGFHME